MALRRPDVDPSPQAASRRACTACAARAAAARSRRPSRPARAIRDLIAIVPVHFDEHLHAERARLRGQVGDERERLRDHEAAGAGLLDRRSRPRRGESRGCRRRGSARGSRRDTAGLPGAWTSMSICSLVNVVQSSSALAVRRLVPRERQPGTDRVQREQIRRRCAPRGNTRAKVRNRPAYGDASPRASKSANCGDWREMWLTITSAMTSVRDASAATSSQEPSRGSTCGVVDRIEARVGAVDRMEERQHVHAAERARAAGRRAGAEDRGTCRRSSRST